MNTYPLNRGERVPLVACFAALCLGAAAMAADPPSRGPLQPMPRVPEALSAKDQATRPGDPIDPKTLPSALRERVMKHAALSAKVRGAAVTIAEARAVTWNDGAMGCGAPGGIYTQALVPGYWLRVRAGNRELTYHTDQGRTFVLCESGSPKKMRPVPKYPGDPVTGPKKPPTQPNR